MKDKKLNATLGGLLGVAALLTTVSFVGSHKEVENELRLAEQRSNDVATELVKLRGMKQTNELLAKYNARVRLDHYDNINGKPVARYELEPLSR